jgi:hypothetical protein
MSLLLFPLIVSPAELAIPSFGGLEVCHFAETLGLGPYVLLSQQYFAVYFSVEGELHLAVSGPSASLLALAAVFLPAK